MTPPGYRFRRQCEALMVERSGEPLDDVLSEVLDRYVSMVMAARALRRAIRRDDEDSLKFLRELVRVEDAAQRYGQSLGLEPVAPAKQPGRPKGAVSAPDRKPSAPAKVTRLRAVGS